MSDTCTNFGPQTIGIRNVNMPEWSLSNTQLGIKFEGVLGDLGWSVNALTYRSQLPSLRAGNVPVVNPFTGGPAQTWDHLIAFDVYFPRVNLFGGSIDYYSQMLDTVWRVPKTSSSMSGRRSARTAALKAGA